MRKTFRINNFYQSKNLQKLIQRKNFNHHRIIPMSRINAWSVLIIVSVILIGTFSQKLNLYTSPENCEGQSKKAALVYGTITQSTQDYCVPTKKLVDNCFLYSISDGKCWCNKYGGAPYTYNTDIGSQVKFCVPINKQLLYAVSVYCTQTEISSKYTQCQQSCLSSSTHYKEVNLVVADRINDFSKGCSNFDIPNCQLYSLKERSEGNLHDFICSVCKQGARQYSTRYGQSLRLTTGIQNNIHIQSIACPLDVGPINTEHMCKNMTLVRINNNLDYKCYCKKYQIIIRVSMTYNKENRNIRGCQNRYGLGQSALDFNCQQLISLYYKKLQCQTCKSGFALGNFKGDQKNEEFKKCFPQQNQIIGCSEYFAADTENLGSYGLLQCAKCDQKNYDQFPIGNLITILGQSDRSKMCLPKGRWSYNTNRCASYIPPNSLSRYLKCATCKQDIAENSQTLNPPCYLSSDLPTDADLCKADLYGGFVVKTNDRSKRCILTGIIQDCQIYKDVQNGRGYGGCVKCRQNYIPVKAYNDKIRQSKMVCIPKDKEISNCDIFLNINFTCKKCANNYKRSNDKKSCTPKVS